MSFPVSNNSDHTSGHKHILASAYDTFVADEIYYAKIMKKTDLMLQAGHMIREHKSVRRQERQDKLNNPLWH